uniref:Uncharacterized protein n=1 Tax=Vespula pensylvanica TaxID=30213 RepID=A0A834JV28_VESPE|nr:hypothetical protein H0235_017100 [Vespula pensylvanica]
MKKLRVAPRCSEMRHRPGGAPYNFATLSDSGEARAFWLYRNQGRRASIPNSTDRHDRIEQNRIEQNRIKWNGIKQNRTEQKLNPLNRYF